MKRHHFKQYLTLILTLILALQGLLTSAVQLQPVIAADDGHNLATKLGDGQSILKDMVVSFTDSHGKEVANDQVTPSTNMSFTTGWAIPESVNLKAGDYYEFELPKQMANQQIAVDNLAIQGTGKDGKKVTVGSCSVTDSGLVRLTFNEKAAELKNIVGTFEHTSKGMNVSTTGHQEIVLPVSQTQETTVPIEVQTDKLPGINKTGKQEGTSNKVDWTLDANNKHVAMTDGYIDEQLPDSLVFDDVMIVESNVDIDGNVTTPKTLTKLTRDKDYTVEDVMVNGQSMKRIHFIGDYKQTKASFQVTVKTHLKDDERDYKWESITNRATLHYGNATIPDPPTANNSTTINYVPQKKLHKAFVGKTEGQNNYSWVVHYNESGEKLLNVNCKNKLAT